MSELAQWACRSPVRLVALVAVTVTGVAIAGWLNAGSASRAERVPERAGASAQLPATAGSVPAAVRFVETWARVRPGDTEQQWLDAVSALATDDLTAGLALTDPAAVPDTTPSGQPSVRFAAEDSALVVVPLASGDRVAVTVVRAGRGWLASDIQPDVGDHGAAP